MLHYTSIGAAIGLLVAIVLFVVFPVIGAFLALIGNEHLIELFMAAMEIAGTLGGMALPGLMIAGFVIDVLNGVRVMLLGIFNAVFK